MSCIERVTDGSHDGSSGPESAGGGRRGGMVGRHSVFPVWVSLSRFFPSMDPRARCVVSAGASRGRCVRWLTRRLRRTLSLRGRLHLLLRGHLLPPGEPLALLRPGDEIEVIPAIDHVVDLSREASPPAEPARDHRRSSSPRLPRPPSPPAALPAPPSPPVETEVDAEGLLEMKRRALRLLEQHAERQTERAGRRRRRVRRRRAPAPPEEPDTPALRSEVEAPCSPPPRVGSAPSSPLPRVGSVPPVVRMARGAGLAARCVRALSAPPLPDPPTPDPSAARSMSSADVSGAAPPERRLRKNNISPST